MDLKDIELFLSFLISRLCQKSKIIAFWNNVWSILQEIKTSSCLWLGDNIIWLSNQCPGQEGSPEVSMITRWMSGLTSMNCNLQIYLSLTFLIFLYMFLGHFCFVKSNNFHYFNYFKKINKIPCVLPAHICGYGFNICSQHPCAIVNISYCSAPLLICWPSYNLFW